MRYGRIDMMNSHVYLKNTVSGVVEAFDAKTADRYLSIPQFAKILERVNYRKNEVLSNPYTYEGGERKPLEDGYAIGDPLTEEDTQSVSPLDVPKTKKKDS